MSGIELRDEASRPTTPIVGGGRLAYRWSEAFGGVGCVSGTEVGGSYRPHAHATFVIAAMEAGSFTAIADGSEYKASAGSVVIFSPHQVHAERWGAGTFSALYPSADVIRVALGRAAFRFSDLAWARPCFHAPGIATLILRLRDLMFGRAASAIVEEHLRYLLRVIDQWAPPIANALLTARRPILALRDRLQADLAERPRIPELARALGMSEFHLIRVFRSAVGLPPHAYWEALRIASAKEMLIAGRSIMQVGMTLGYSDQSHFTRHFKRTVRVTPGAYSDLVRGAQRRTR